MKTAPLTLEFGSTKLTASHDGLLQASGALAQLGADKVDWDWFRERHGLTSPARDFGAGPEPTLSVPEFVALAFKLDTPAARRWRKRSQDLLASALTGDVKLAAQIAERNPDPDARRWLAARLESTEARRELMSTVARRGGHGAVYRQLGSLSNRSVLGMNSTALRRERGVKNTRDGLSSAELLRMAYLDTATARALEEQNAEGNAAILAVHEQTLIREQKLWESGALPRSG
ncbi:DNA damage response protein DdrC [Deinococcus radiophilus]|uniref:DNA damage response protein DdrC n=1 Tax=Deinococcus radiophilus TaxID=32062 RepID=A0A3S0KM76_9DEIO|nr:DNA damage response protein DdrC [Deinococcus radiophilus]RTR29898.1 DNA damage response protein DdrC [Deinococcus radiophilus]UFA49749.1 DNA damage response protein DdrC [Deinococcus radiophilus]